MFKIILVCIEWRPGSEINTGLESCHQNVPQFKNFICTIILNLLCLSLLNMIRQLTLNLLCFDCRVRIKTGKIRRVSEAVCLQPLLPPPAPLPEPAPLFLLPSLSWALRPGPPHPRSEKVRRMRRPLGFCKTQTPPRVQKRTVAQRTHCWPRCSHPTPSLRSHCPLLTWIWTSLTSENVRLQDVTVQNCASVTGSGKRNGLWSHFLNFFFGQLSKE